ncbi:MAG: hypothetical protein EXX96DRAFT_482768 [Benjaminiella poitrasii]|nr:MAG: hypothetical protein EXX96DRAFT_482768 [Benjaminiella poitrasii]
MSLTIGWSLNDDHDFDTLMVTILIGSMALFLLSLSTNVNQQLPPPDAVPDEESTLFICYKPYSLFREHLSHISEEVTTSIDTATRHNTTSHHNQKKLDVILSSASYQLARLPFPPPQSTVVVLMDLPTYYSEDEDDNRCAGSVVISFLCSTFMLGVVWGMSQTFVFVYLDSLNAPMHLIGAVGAVTVIADLLARLAILVYIYKYIYRSWLMMAYGLLMSCLVLHVWLEPAKDVHQMILSMQFVILVLQLLQVDEVILSGYQRMMVKGGMAALYSSIGPAVGVLWMAYLVSSAHHYELVYQYAAGVTCLSAVLSWEWANYVY